MKTLKIRHNVPNALSVDNLVPSFKNFGEEVYVLLRGDCQVSLAEIDKATSEFYLRGIHKRKVRNIAAKVRRILENRYPMLPPIEIIEIDDA